VLSWRASATTTQTLVVPISNPAKILSLAIEGLQF
jgi:hypothetical protein